jgi:primosomal protein N''
MTGSDNVFSGKGLFRMKAFLLAGLLAALPALAGETTTEKVKASTDKAIDDTSDALQKAKVKTKEGTKKALRKTGDALNDMSRKINPEK